MRPIHFILANCKYGQRKSGVELGPYKLFKKINSVNLNSNNQYNIINTPEFRNYNGYKMLYNDVKINLKHNKMPVVLGGDHSISAASVAGSFDIFKENLTVIWMDAHADINTPLTSNTGNLHGMPLASVYNLMKPIVNSDYKPKYEQLIYLGLRDIDDAERHFLDKYNILYFDMRNIRKEGISKICEIVNNKSNNNIHLSFDIDVLDPSLVPATGTPVDDGMNIDEATEFIENFKKEKDIKILDFVEYNPLLADIDNRTIHNSSFLINKIIN